MKFFVYGTLMEGFENYRIYLEGKVRTIQKATVEGIIYHLPEGYPAMIPGSGPVKGEVIEVTDSKILEEIDLLEEYKGEGEENLYDRVPVEAETERGEKISCWTYFYGNREYAEKCGKHISDGDWGKFYNENRERVMKKYFAWGEHKDPEVFKLILEEGDCDKNFKVLGSAKLPDYKIEVSAGNKKNYTKLTSCNGEYVEGILYEVPLKVIQTLEKKENYMGKELKVYINNREYKPVTFEHIFS